MESKIPRHERVAATLQRTLAELLQFESKDPRFKTLTLTTVRVAHDLSHAKIYYLCDAEADREAIQTALKKAAGYFRSEIASRMQLRIVPTLNFVYDKSVDDGAHLSKLIDDAMQHVSDDPEDEDV